MDHKKKRKKKEKIWKTYESNDLVKLLQSIKRIVSNVLYPC